jgi:hypothetical protein
VREPVEVTAVPRQEATVGTDGAEDASEEGQGTVAAVGFRRVLLLAPVATSVRSSSSVSLRIRPTVMASTPSASRMPAAVDHFRSRVKDFWACLVGVGVGEGDQRPIEAVTGPQIGADGDRIPGSSMGPG